MKEFPDRGFWICTAFSCGKKITLNDDGTVPEHEYRTDGWYSRQPKVVRCRKSGTRATQPNPQWVAFRRKVDGYRSQGYGQEAATALVEHDEAEERAAEAIRQKEADLARGRESYRQQQEAIARGELASCPDCGSVQKVSQGVVLSHQVKIGEDGEGLAAPWGRCLGSGSRVR